MDKLILSLGGTPWLNLVNTTYTSEKKTVDILDDHLTAQAWLNENGFFHKEEQRIEKEMIEDLKSLREQCKQALEDLTNDGKLSSTSLQRLNQQVKNVQVGLTIQPVNEKTTLLTEGITPKDHLLYKIVESIFHTIETVAVTRIRNCEHQECQLYFVDTSKSGKRRWCSMEICGNRQKAAEFYARKKEKK